LTKVIIVVGGNISGKEWAGKRLGQWFSNGCHLAHEGRKFLFQGGQAMDENTLSFDVLFNQHTKNCTRLV